MTHTAPSPIQLGIRSELFAPFAAPSSRARRDALQYILCVLCPRDETDGFRSRCADRLASGETIEGDLLADRSPKDRGHHRRYETNLHLGIAKLGGGGRRDDVARAGETAAAGKTRPRTAATTDRASGRFSRIVRSAIRRRAERSAPEPELRHVAVGARSDRESDVALQNLLLEARPLARLPQRGECTTR